MKRVGFWFNGLGVMTALILYGCGQGAVKAQGEPDPAEEDQAATETAPGAERVVHSFSDDAQLQAFANLWQQRQGVTVRLTVLRAYVSEEESALTQLNNIMHDDYSIDPLKEYLLDTERRVILEVERPAPAEEPPADAGPS